MPEPTYSGFPVEQQEISDNEFKKDVLKDEDFLTVLEYKLRNYHKVDNVWKPIMRKEYFTGKDGKMYVKEVPIEPYFTEEGINFLITKLNFYTTKGVKLSNIDAILLRKIILNIVDSFTLAIVYNYKKLINSNKIDIGELSSYFDDIMNFIIINLSRAKDGGERDRIFGWKKIFRQEIDEINKNKKEGVKLF